jgi:hypothetical protein
MVIHWLYKYLLIYNGQISRAVELELEVRTTSATLREL